MKLTDYSTNVPLNAVQHVTALTAFLEAQASAISLLISGNLSRFQSDQPGPQLSLGQLVVEAVAEPVAAVRGQVFDNIQAAADKFSRFVLIGAAGSGKTVLLNQIALTAARNYQLSPQVAPIPLRLSLAGWSEESTPETFIRANWSLDGDPIRLLAQGRIALYLDGLNEVEGQLAAKTSQLCDWLAGNNAPQRIVITCRTADYISHTQLGLPVIQLTPPDTAQIQPYVHANLDAQTAQVFLDQLSNQNQPGLNRFQMARQPFLLNALLAVFTRHPDTPLPTNSCELLRRLILELWDTHAAAVANNISYETVETALSELAFEIIENDQPVFIPVNEARRFTSQPAILTAALAAQLLTLEGAKIRFAHQVLQDYFASLKLARIGFPTRLSRPEFNAKGQRLPRKWDQALIILANATAQPDNLILNIAEVDPYLALKCAISLAAVSERTIKTITRQILDPASGDNRIALAGVFTGVDDAKAMLILLEVMRDTVWPLRQLATNVFSEMQLPVLPGLAEAIEELDDQSRETTLTALHQLGKNAIPTLLQLIRSDNWHHRRGAAWALGELRDRAAVPVLTDTLNDADYAVSADAAYALGRIKDPAAIPALLNALNHQNWRVAKAASRALANLGKPTISALIKTLDGKVNAVPSQLRAIEALALIDDPAAAATLLDATYMQNVEIRSAAVEGLRSFRGEAVTKRLIECLSDTDKPRASKQRICDLAAEILDAMSGIEASSALEQWHRSQTITPAKNTHTSSGKKAKERLERAKENAAPLPTNLVTALTDTDWVVRRDAVTDLVAVAPEAAIPRLEQALDDEDNQVRLAAIRALAQFPHEPRALSSLIQALNDDEYLVCDAAKEVLKKIGKPPQPALVEILNSGTLNARGAAIEILGSIKDTSAIPSLIDCLADMRRPWLSNERICDIAAQALQAIDAPEAAAAVQQWTGLVPTANPPPLTAKSSTALVSNQPDALGELLERLHADDWETRQKAAKALSDYAQNLRGVVDQSVTRRLVAALSDANWPVRLVVAEALGWFRDRSTAAELSQLLHDPKWKVRVAAIRSLGEIGEQTVVEAIIETLTDTHSLVREAAAEALGNLGDPRAANALVLAISDSERFVRLAAIEALGKLQDPETITPLVGLLTDADEAVRCFAVYALIKIGQTPIIPALIASLEDTAVPSWEDRRICDIAAAALEMFGSPEARTALQDWKNVQIPHERKMNLF